MKFFCAGYGDIGKVLRLWQKAGVYNNSEDRQGLLKRLLDFDDEAIVVVRKSSDIIASAVIVYNPFQSIVYRFSVDPDFRGRGIEEILAQRVEDALRKRGIHHVTLFVEEVSQATLHFWLKRDWKRLHQAHCFKKDL